MTRVHTLERHVANAYRKIGVHNQGGGRPYVTRRKLTTRRELT